MNGACPQLFQELDQAAAANDPTRVKAALQRMLPGYQPAEPMLVGGGAAAAPYPDYF